MEEQGIIYAWTPMIRMSDMKYPVYLSDFREEHRNVSMGDWVWEEGMGKDFQYFVVRDSEKPEGDVVTEGQPEQGEDGKWYKTWTARDFTEEEVAQNLSVAKADIRVRAYQVFSTDLTTGIPIGDKTVVVEPREIINIDTIRAFAVANPEEKVFLRFADYSVEEYTAEEAIAKVDEIIIATGRVQQNLLRYLKEVNETDLITNLPEVPSTFTGE